MWIRFQFWFWSIMPTSVVAFNYNLLRLDKNPRAIALAEYFCRIIKERQEAKTNNEPTEETNRPGGG